MIRPDRSVQRDGVRCAVLLLGLTALASGVAGDGVPALSEGVRAEAAASSEPAPESAPESAPHSASDLAWDRASGRASGAESEPTLEESFELTLELARHERLVRQKRDPSSSLSAFTSDGCSGGLSAAWDAFASWVGGFRQVHGTLPPWEHCCVEHDRLYHAAGPRDATPRQGFDARRAADLELRRCVLATGTARTPELAAEYGLTEAQVAGLYRAIADLMYRSVRLGGTPCSGLPWRWGYGWPRCD
jgi:hypothetical protein